MPSSTITCRQIKKPDNHNVLENTYVYIKPTFYYWSVWYGNGSASLMCCYYEDNPAVNIRVIDNNHGRGNAKPATIDDVPSRDINEIYNQSLNEVERAFDQNEISERIYKGLKGTF